jgi:hypothetical protein
MRELCNTSDHTKAKATLEVPDLVASTLKNSISVFETQEKYLIPSGITLKARKEKLKVHPEQ